MPDVANALTVLRLVLIPVLLYFMFLGYNVVALFVFALAGLTDWLDGFVARSSGRVTEFGTLADPFVDRIFVLSIVVALYLRDGLPPLWALSIFIIRDLLVMLGYGYLRGQGVKIAVSYLGKRATAFLMISFFFLLGKFAVGLSIFYLGLFLYIISGLDYLRKALGELELKRTGGE